MLRLCNSGLSSNVDATLMPWVPFEEQPSTQHCILHLQRKLVVLVVERQTNQLNMEFVDKI
jgi:hypothetical protein